MPRSSETDPRRVYFGNRHDYPEASIGISSLGKVQGLDHQFQEDVEAIGRICAVPTILDVVCRTTGMGFAAVARVTDKRWITCRSLDHLDFGLKPGDELDVGTTICHEVRDHREPVVINQASIDPVYCDHPTPQKYRFESYISMPIIRANGEFFGTLCAIDPNPAKLDSSETVGMFRLFAQLVASQLDADDRLAAAEASLVSERRVAELRDQFIAVLGHDLRNPISSIEAGMKMLLREPLNDRSRHIATLVKGSVIRMRDLTDNILDFARGRLGDGITLERTIDGELEKALMQVVDELQTAHPDQILHVKIEIDRPVSCDTLRMGQLLSNLLGNAMIHGANDGLVSVFASTSDDTLKLRVENAGEAMSNDAMAHLFQPFFRGDGGKPSQGLGLGLFIASEIAKAHGGTLSAASDRTGTRMTFEMPLTS